MNPNQLLALLVLLNGVAAGCNLMAVATQERAKAFNGGLFVLNIVFVAWHVTRIGG